MHNLSPQTKKHITYNVSFAYLNAAYLTMPPIWYEDLLAYASCFSFSLRLLFYDQLPCAEKRSGVPFKIHVLPEARPSALKKHEQKTRHAEYTTRRISHIRLLLEFWSFSGKAKYARLRTLPRSLVGSRSSSFQPCNVPRRIKGFALSGR